MKQEYASASQSTVLPPDAPDDHYSRSLGVKRPSSVFQPSFLSFSFFVFIGPGRFENMYPAFGQDPAGSGPVLADFIGL